MKFDFLNHEGEKLSGRLEIPSGTPAASALFAHCFTCSKDVIAAHSISKALAEQGFAVLRFDFTGLGNSEGDFANTNFSSNVEDLLAAFRALKEHFGSSPELLVGHSLGGAAVLKAAAKLEDVKAVVTIGAPSSVEHLTHLFQKELPKIDAEGDAEVVLSGRKFKITRQFVKDIQEAEILSDVKAFKKALLILHSPLDKIVSIDHAAKIFMSAKHPKSFISLDDADHLLMNRKDANYAAQMIASWGIRYISHEAAERPKLNEGVLVKSRVGTRFTQDIYTKDHHIIADEPVSMKGDNLGLNPYELLLAGLGACTSMTLRMYADHKEIPLDSVEVKLHHSKIHAKECESCEEETGNVDRIEKKISLTGSLSEDQRSRLYEIAEKCPVNRTLNSEVKIEAKYG